MDDKVKDALMRQLMRLDAAADRAADSERMAALTGNMCQITEQLLKLQSVDLLVKAAK